MASRATRYALALGLADLAMVSRLSHTAMRASCTRSSAVSAGSQQMPISFVARLRSPPFLPPLVIVIIAPCI